MFVVNMTFISSREVKKCAFGTHEIHFFTSRGEIKVKGTHEIYIFSLHKMK